MGGKLLKRIKLILIRLINQLMFIIKYPYLYKVKVNNLKLLYLPFGARIGAGSKLLFDSVIDGAARIRLERNVWIGESVELHVWHKNEIHVKDGASVQDRCKILGDVELGQNCILAPNVFISSGTHYATYKPYDLIRNQDKEILSTLAGQLAHSKKVVVGEDAWLGVNVYVKAGVEIGRGALIGANSVITKSIPPYSIVGGINKILGRRFEFDPPLVINGNNEEHRPYFYSGFKRLNVLSKGEVGKILIKNEAKKVRISVDKKDARININDKDFDVSLDNEVCFEGEKIFNKKFGFKEIVLKSNKEITISKIEVEV